MIFWHLCTAFQGPHYGHDCPSHKSVFIKHVLKKSQQQYEQ